LIDGWFVNLVLKLSATGIPSKRPDTTFTLAHCRFDAGLSAAAGRRQTAPAQHFAFHAGLRALNIRPLIR
jgi:hypothetical protein